VTRETTGIAYEGSLAAESKEAGGEFASNRNARVENMPSSESEATPASHRASATTSKTTPTTAEEQSEQQGGPAPTYVNNLYRQDKHGPHGKNLTEGFEDEGKFEDGTQKAMKAEPGSKDDPARASVQKMQTATGQGSGGGAGDGAFSVLGDEAA
jgi:hypothetical protein